MTSTPFVARSVPIAGTVVCQLSSVASVAPTWITDTACDCRYWPIISFLYWMKK